MIQETDRNYRVFIFSQTQHDQIIKLETQLNGVKPTFGQVIVNGTPKVYTAIVKSRSNLRYPDSKILIDGDITTIKYTKSSYGG